MDEKTSINSTSASAASKRHSSSSTTSTSNNNEPTTSDACKMSEIDESSSSSVANESESNLQPLLVVDTKLQAVNTTTITTTVPPPLPQSSPPSISTPPTPLKASGRNLQLDLSRAMEDKLIISEHSAADVCYIEQIDESETPSPPPMPIVEEDDDEPTTTTTTATGTTKRRQQHRIIYDSFDAGSREDQKEINLNSICNNLNNSYNNSGNQFSAIKPSGSVNLRPYPVNNGPTISNQNISSSGSGKASSFLNSSGSGNWNHHNNATNIAQSDQSMANCLQQRKEEEAGEDEERSSRILFDNDKYLAKLAENYDRRTTSTATATLTTRENKKRNEQSPKSNLPTTTTTISSNSGNNNNNEYEMNNPHCKMSNFEYLTRINNLNNSASSSMNGKEMAASSNRNRFLTGSSLASGSGSGLSAVTTAATGSTVAREDVNLTDTSSNTSCDMNINNDLISDNDADVDYNLIEEIGVEESGVLFGHEILNANTFFSQQQQIGGGYGNADFGGQIYKSLKNGGMSDEKHFATSRAANLSTQNGGGNTTYLPRPIEPLKEELVISLNKPSTLQQSPHPTSSSSNHATPKSNMAASSGFYLTNEEFKNSSKLVNDDQRTNSHNNSSSSQVNGSSDGIRLLKTFTNMKTNTTLSTIRRDETQKCYSYCDDQSTSRVDHSVVHVENYPTGAKNGGSGYKSTHHRHGQPASESVSLMSLNEKSVVDQQHSTTTTTTFSKVIPIKIEFKDEQEKNSLRRQRSNLPQPPQLSFDVQKTSAPSSQTQAADTKSIQSNGSVKKVSNLKKTNSNGSSAKPRQTEKVKFSDVELRHMINSNNDNTDENTYSTITQAQQPSVETKPILRNSSNRPTQPTTTTSQRPISTPADSSILMSYQPDPILSSATIKDKSSSLSRSSTSKAANEDIAPIPPQRLRHSNTISIGEMQRYRSNSSESSESSRVKMDKGFKRQSGSSKSQQQHFSNYYDLKKRQQLQPRSDYNINYYDRNHQLSSQSCSSSSLSSSISSLSSDSGGGGNLFISEYEKHGYRQAGCSSSLPPLHRMHYTLQPLPSNYYQSSQKSHHHPDSQVQYQQQQQPQYQTEEIYINNLNNQTRHEKKSKHHRHHRRHQSKRHHSSSRHRHEYYPHRHSKSKDYDTASMHIDTSNMASQNINYSTLPSSNSISSIHNFAKPSKKKSSSEKKKHSHHHHHGNSSHHHRRHRHHSKNHSICESKESIASHGGHRKQPVSVSNNSLYSLNTAPAPVPVAAVSSQPVKVKGIDAGQAAKTGGKYQHVVDNYNIYASVPAVQDPRSLEEYQRLGKYSNMSTAPAYYSVVPSAAPTAQLSYQPYQSHPIQTAPNGNYYSAGIDPMQTMTSSATLSSSYGNAQITAHNNSVNLVNNSSYEAENAKKKVDETASLGESINQPNYQLIRPYMPSSQAVYSNASENYLDYYDETGRLVNRHSLSNIKPAGSNGALPNSTASSRFKAPSASNTTNYHRPPTTTNQVNRLMSQPGVNMAGSSASLATAVSNSLAGNYMNMNNGSIATAAEENQKSSAIMSMIYSSPQYTDLITENASFIDSPIHLLLNHHKQQRLMKQQKLQQKQNELSEISELFSKAASFESEERKGSTHSQQQQPQPQQMPSSEPKTVNSIINIDSSRDAMKEESNDEIYVMNEVVVVTKPVAASSSSMVAEKSAESFQQAVPESSEREPLTTRPPSCNERKESKYEQVNTNKAYKMKWTTKIRNFFAIMIAALLTISSMYLFEIISCIFRIENVNILFQKLSTFLVSFGIVVVMTCNYCFVDPDQQRADKEAAAEAEDDQHEVVTTGQKQSSKLLQMPSADPASYQDEYDSDNQTSGRAYRAYSNALLTLQVSDSCSPHSSKAKQKSRNATAVKEQLTFILPKSYYFNIFYSSNTNEADQQPHHSPFYPDSLPIGSDRDYLVNSGSKNEMYDLNTAPPMAMPTVEFPFDKKPTPEPAKKPTAKQLKRLKQLKLNKLIKNNKKLKPRFYLLVTSILLIHFWLLSSYLIYYFTSIQTTAHAGSPSLTSFLNVAYFIEILTAIIGGIGAALLAKCVVLNLFELYANNQALQGHLIEISNRIRASDIEKANKDNQDSSQCEVFIEDDLESSNTVQQRDDASSSVAPSTSKYRKTHLSALHAYQKLIFKFFILLQSHWLILAGLIYYVIRLIGIESIDSIFSKVCMQSIVSSSGSKLCPVSILKNDVFSWKHEILLRKTPSYNDEPGRLSNPHAGQVFTQKNHTFKGFLDLFDPQPGAVGVSSSIKLFTIEDVYLLLISISLIKFILSLFISFLFIKTKRPPSKLANLAMAPECAPNTTTKIDMNPVKAGYLRGEKKKEDAALSDDDHGGFLNSQKTAYRQLNKSEKPAVVQKASTVCGHMKLKPTLPLLHLMMPLVFFQGFVKTILLNELDKV